MLLFLGWSQLITCAPKGAFSKYPVVMGHLRAWMTTVASRKSSLFHSCPHSKYGNQIISGPLPNWCLSTEVRVKSKSLMSYRLRWSGPACFLVSSIVFCCHTELLFGLQNWCASGHLHLSLSGLKCSCTCITSCSQPFQFRSHLFKCIR